MGQARPAEAAEYHESDQSLNSSRWTGRPLDLHEPILVSAHRVKMRYCRFLELASPSAKSPSQHTAKRAFPPAQLKQTSPRSCALEGFHGENPSLPPSHRLTRATPTASQLTFSRRQRDHQPSYRKPASDLGACRPHFPYPVAGRLSGDR